MKDKRIVPFGIIEGFPSLCSSKTLYPVWNFAERYFPRFLNYRGNPHVDRAAHFQANQRTVGSRYGYGQSLGQVCRGIHAQCL